MAALILVDGRMICMMEKGLGYARIINIEVTLRKMVLRDLEF